VKPHETRSIAVADRNQVRQPVRCRDAIAASLKPLPSLALPSVVAAWFMAQQLSMVTGDVIAVEVPSVVGVVPRAAAAEDVAGARGLLGCEPVGVLTVALGVVVLVRIAVRTVLLVPLPV